MSALPQTNEREQDAKADGDQERILAWEEAFPVISPSAASLFIFDRTSGTITGVRDSSVTQLSIPEAIDGVEVIAIGERALAGLSRLQVLVVPDTVQEIGEDAFSGCTGLQWVRLSEGLTELKTGTFENCSALPTVVIPAGVERLAGYIFLGCCRLEAILFEDEAFKERCLATDPKGSREDYAAGIGQICWYAFKEVGRALVGLDFHESYKGTKWHTGLQALTPTEDLRQNILEVYKTQLGYREGFTPDDVSGFNTKPYRTPPEASYWEWGHFTEASRYHGLGGTTWCYAFTQWAWAMAGIPVTLGTRYYTWDQFTCAGGDYDPAPGDIIGVGKTHLAMVGHTREEEGTFEILILNGNHPDRNVAMELIRYDSFTGEALEICEDGDWRDLGRDAEAYRIRSLYSPRLEEVVLHHLFLDPGEGTVSQEGRVIAEEAVYGALPDARLEDAVFVGWYTQPEGGERILPYQMFKETRDQTLYARYRVCQESRD